MQHAACIMQSKVLQGFAKVWCHFLLVFGAALADAQQKLVQIIANAIYRRLRHAHRQTYIHIVWLFFICHYVI